MAIREVGGHMHTAVFEICMQWKNWGISPYSRGSITCADAHRDDVVLCLSSVLIMSKL